MSTSNRAHIKDTQSLVDFHSGLGQANSTLDSAISAAEKDISSTRQLIESRIKHWEEVRRRCEEQLRRANSDSASRAAQQCIAAASNNLSQLGNIQNDVERAARDFKQQVGPLKKNLSASHQTLSHIIQALEEYTETGTDSPGGTTSSSLTGNPVGTASSSLTKNIQYGELDERGRPTGVRAIITKEMINTGSEVNRKIYPPGYKGREFGHARGHLLARSLGGSGDEPGNLVTIYQNPVNMPDMWDVERETKARVEAGEVVEYTAIPNYNGNEEMPTSITIIAKGNRGFFISRTVFNQKKRR